jgi:hypothetical protein
VTTAMEETGMKEAIRIREVTSEAEHTRNNRETVYIRVIYICERRDQTVITNAANL